MYVLLLQGIIDLVGRLFRSIWYFLDHTIYSWVPKLYNALISISRTSPLSQADIADMADRIYKLLAVFMVFKVTFSLIMYVVNPDDFSDKNKGVSKLVTNIVISLGLLVLTPYIFSYAYQFQIMILKNNTLATVIFGKDLSREGNTIDSVGDQIAFIAMSPFLIPDLSRFPKCNTLYNIEYDNNGKPVTVLNDECFGFKDVDEYAANPASCSGNDTLCSYVCGRGMANNNHECTSYGFSSDVLINYAVGVKRGNYRMLFKKDAVVAMIEIKTKDKNGKEVETTEFIFDYSYILSTAVAIIILLFFITTCMDIGLRSIKLAFLQLIAPIPILSYIDPKSGKDGMFKKWYQMALKTYLSLFIRLLALYFAIYVIGRLNSLTDIIDGSYVATGVVQVFIVIGALMFAKNFIKILEDLGIKLDGGFTLRPIKKIKDQALGGKQLVGAAGALTAAGAAGAANLAHRGVGGLINAGKSAMNKAEAWRGDRTGAKGFLTGAAGLVAGATGGLVSGAFRTAGSTVAGVASAGHRGLIRAGKGEGFFKTFGNSYGEAMFAKKQREDLQRKVGADTFAGRVGFTARSTAADVERWLGVFNAGQRQEMKLAEVEAEFTNRRNKQKMLKEELDQRYQDALVTKNKDIKQSQIKQDNFSTITKTIATLKNPHINVKDREENVKQMQERGEWYAKVGDTITKRVKAGDTYARKIKKGETYLDSSGVLQTATEDIIKTERATADGEVTTVATQADVDHLALTAAGAAADKDLKKARTDGLKYLKDNDGAVAKILKDSHEILMSDDAGLSKMLKDDDAGIRAMLENDTNPATGTQYTTDEINAIMDNDDKAARNSFIDSYVASIVGDEDKRSYYIDEILLTDPSKIKTLTSIAEREVADINTDFAKTQQKYDADKESIDLQLKTIEEEYKQRIKNEHVDKTSLEWVRNEAANAARSIKNKEPEGFKPSPIIDESTYTPFKTNLQQGNAAAATPPTGRPGGGRPMPPPGGGGTAGP